MKIIPLIAAASQRFSVLLENQNCQIILEQKGDFMYLSLSVNYTTIFNTMICRDRVKLVRYEYLGFVGNLVFVDTQGTTDPVYTDLGGRYVLAYLP